MKLLKTSDVSGEIDKEFEEVTEVALESLAPEVIDGNSDIRCEKNLEECDAAFLNIPESNPIFGRVLLEIIQEKNIKTCQPGLGFYITAKKNYLSYVMEQQGIPSPRTVVASSENAAKNTKKHLETPIIAKRYEENSLVESKKLDELGEVDEFATGTEYGGEILIFQQATEGKKYKVFYAGDSFISLQDTSEGFKISEDRLKYSSLSSDLKKTVEKAMKSIGTQYGEVILRDEKIVDIKPNPDPSIYTKKSGKNAFSYIRAIFE